MTEGQWDKARASGRMDDWQAEVANGDTLLGFFEWVANNPELLLALTRDITAGELAMDSPEPGEGYPPEHVIGPAGTTVRVMDPAEWEDGEESIEVDGFATDDGAAGYVPRSALTERP